MSAKTQEKSLSPNKLWSVLTVDGREADACSNVGEPGQFSGMEPGRKVAVYTSASVSHPEQAESQTDAGCQLPGAGGAVGWGYLRDSDTVDEEVTGHHCDGLSATEWFTLK